MNIPLQDNLSSVSLADGQGSHESKWFIIASAVSSWPLSVMVWVLIGLILSVGWIDYVTGFDISVSFLYLIPITIGTWVAGRFAGKVVSLVSAGVWLITDLLSGHSYGDWRIPLWDALTLAISFLVVVALLSSLHQAHDGLARTVALRTKALEAENARRSEAEEDLRQALRKVQNTQTELRQTQIQLVEAAKMKSFGRLAVSVAHEIKTPLATLSLGVDYFLSRRAENPEEAQLVQEMEKAIRHANKLTNVVLDFSQQQLLHRDEAGAQTALKFNTGPKQQP